MALNQATERLQQERVESQQGGTNAYHIRETAQGIEELLAITIQGNKHFSDYFKQQKVEAGDRKETLNELKRGNRKGAPAGGATKAIKPIKLKEQGMFNEIFGNKLSTILGVAFFAKFRNALGLTAKGFSDFGKGLKTFAKNIPGVQFISDKFNKFITGLNKAGTTLFKFAKDATGAKGKLLRTALLPFTAASALSKKFKETNQAAIALNNRFQSTKKMTANNKTFVGKSLFGKDKFKSKNVTSLSQMKAFNQAGIATKFLARMQLAFGGMGKTITDAVNKTAKAGGVLSKVGFGLKAFGTILGKLNPFTFWIFMAIDAISGIKKRFSKLGGEDMGGIKGIVKKLFAFTYGAIEGIAQGFVAFPLDLVKNIFGFMAGLLGFDNVKEALKNFSFKDATTKIFDSFFDRLFMMIDIISAGFKPLMKQAWADIKLKMAKIVALPGALFSATLAAIKAAPKGLAVASGVFGATLQSSIDNNEGVKTAKLNYLNAQLETGMAVAGALKEREDLKQADLKKKEEEAELAKKNAESAETLAEAAETLNDATGGFVVADSSTSNSGNTTINNSGSGGGGGSTPLPKAWDTFDRNSGWGFA
jgi:hypothetical protein